MTGLFDPIALGPLTVRNRAWVSPMCQYSCEGADGLVGDWHRETLTSFARGGAGLVMTEATAVVPEGRISPWCAGLWSDDHVEAWAPIAERIRELGAVAAVQLGHAGRKASTDRPWAGGGPVGAPLGWSTVGPSALPFGELPAPRALTTEEVEGLPPAFARAAERARDAGFQTVELHAAHGYLLHQFLSPLSNDRDDRWADGTTLLEAIIRAITTAVPDLPVMVRLSATDWVDGGVTLERTLATVRRTHAAGAVWFDISSGGLDPRQQITLGPAYQTPFAQAVREALPQDGSVGVNAVGLIDTPQRADAVIREGRADAVMLARPWQRNPHWALEAERVLSTREHPVDPGLWPRQLVRGRHVSADPS
ncbi:tRNA-dihydrouridine synthase [Brachybacterium sp. EF45031]|uniref:oxidoreductase n=1 Tax=Brachybacterium sillae TaxID=2810536 RepID=UPI00217E7723|nr:tRNA-dihydrouridine synthase [Brachybacterium sillae]MCS6711674.1 tRNA-dihydrouridine synthase [Brachybacterium sillae]